MADKRFFQGLPSPSAAAALVGMVWVCYDSGIAGEDVAIFAAVLTLVIGLLMVSNVLYYSFKEVNYKERVPFIAILVIALILALASIDFPKVLFGSFMIYILSGPLLAVMRRIRKFGRRSKTSPGEGD